MSHPQPPQRQPTPPEVERYAKAVHYTAFVALVACPILAILPPRKLDFFTFGLGGATLFSASFLIREKTGRSILQHLSPERNQQPAHAYAVAVERNPVVPPIEQQVNLQRDMHNATQELQRARVETDGPVMEELRSQRDAWKVQREREIQGDVEEGKGFGDMIMDQIWEVWNWGKTKDDEDD